MAFTPIVSSQTVTGETVISGTQSIVNGGIANSTTINTSGCQNASSGGSANFTTVNSGGSQWIFGGTANSTTINSGGEMRFLGSGVATNTTINSGGVMALGGGVSATNIYQQVGGAVYFATGATVINGMNTRTDGHNSFSIVNGVASNFLLESKGCLLVASGNSAVNTIIGSGAGMNILFGGTATTINQQSGAAILAVTGASITGGTNTRTDGHSSFSIANGVASNFLLENGGNLVVLSGNSAIETLIASRGYQSVLSGGVVCNVIINSSGSLYISSGGNVTGALTVAGGHVVLDNAASVSGLTTMSYVLTTAKTSDVVVTVNGGTSCTGTTAYSLNLNNTASGSYILVDGVDLTGFNGKLFSVSDNGQTVNVQVGSSYTFADGNKLSLTLTDSTRDQLTAILTSGGSGSGFTPFVSSQTVTGETVSSGTQSIVNGGIANSITINTSGWQNISSGGVANSATINSGGWQQIYSGGTVTGAIINNGGMQGVFSGGAAAGTVINSGGWQSVLSGGSATSTTINYRGYQYVGGTASQSEVKSGGMLMVGEGGNAAGFNVSSGGILGWNFNAVFSGTSNGVAVTSSSGKASYNLYLMNGATHNVSSGCTANSTTISSGGYQNISSGGVASINTINSRGTQWVCYGGTANSTTINSSGNQYVFFDAVATLTNINSDGRQWVYGVANSTTVNSGGSQTVFSGGVTSNAVVNSDGSMYASSGGIVSGSLTIAGGHVTMEYSDNLQPAAMSFVLANAKTGDALLTIQSGVVGDISHTAFTLDVNNTVTGDYILGSGSNLTGMSSAVFTVTDDGQSVNVSVGSSYTFADGDKLSINFTDAATDQLTAKFTVSGDVVDTLPPTAPSGLTETGIGKNVSFDWADSTDAGSGVKNYLLEYATNNQFIGAVQSTVAVSNANVSGLTDGVYCWRVKAADNAGNAGSWVNGGSFMVDATAPAVPSGLTMTRSGNNLTTFDWNDASDATSGVKQYQIELDSSNKFSNLEYFKQVTDSQASVANLASGTHYWRVRAQDNSGNLSAWSAAESFTMELVPPTVPGGLKQTVTGSRVAFDWNDSTDTSGIRQYEIRVDNNSDFSSPEYSTLVDVSAASASLALGTYYWQVRGQDNAGNYSTWSSSSKFIVTPTDTAGNTWQTANDIASLDNWVGYGDPADFYKLTMTNAGTLTLGLTGLTGNADLSLLSATGAVLKTSANAGTANESIVQSLLAGFYYVKVAAGTSINDASYTLSHTEKYCPTDTAANTWQSAGDISTLDNWVGFGDSTDFYKLTMTNAGTLTLGLTGLTGNADLSLLSATGTVLKSSANTGTTSEAINNVALLAGTYYVKVAAGTSVNDASYTLSNTIKYCSTDKAANDYKTALDISNLDNWVGFGDSADFYKLTMTNAGTLTLGLTGLTGNADLSLLNASGIASKTSSNTGTTPEAITNVALLAGTYYVKVVAGLGVNDAIYTLTNNIKYCPADKAANDYKTAQDISKLDIWVGFGDAADFYKLTMTNAGTLTLGLTGLTGNADLSLLGATGMVLKSSSNTGKTSEAINNVALLAGTYYVKVATGFGVNDASYTLAHAEKYCPTDAAANTWQTAQDISNLDNWVGFGDTADFYKLTMTNAGTLTLGLTGLTGNADLSLLNSAGTALKTSAKASTANEAINNVSLLAGTYYVKVAAGFGVNDASYNLSNTVSYFPGDISDKAGNTLAAAKLVDSLTQTGWVGFGDSDDYYKFNLAAATQGTLRLYNMTGGNADLTLYDAKGAQLQKSAKTGALEDTITRNLAAGTYYARVNAVSGNIDYKLDFSKKDGYGLLAS